MLLLVLVFCESNCRRSVKVYQEIFPNCYVTELKNNTEKKQECSQNRYLCSLINGEALSKYNINKCIFYSVVSMISLCLRLTFVFSKYLYPLYFNVPTFLYVHLFCVQVKNYNSSRANDQICD